MQTTSLSSLKTACSQCNLRELCLPYGLTSNDLDRIDVLVGGRQKVKQNQPLYRAHENFQAIYAIRTGFFKTDIPTEDGRDQVTGFQMAGELLGMDGIGESRHSCNAIALEDSEVCVIPFEKLEDLSREVSALQRNFHKIMSREIIHDHGLMMMLGTMRAEERLAAFLLNLSQRFSARGYSSQEFHLRMRREEIGSYLGLKIETVSRAFSKLQDDGYINVQQKHVRILDLPGLRALIQTPASAA